MLALESALAEVVSQLRAHGVDPLLLKGAGTARWLYDSAPDRGYDDLDLLVAPGDTARATSCLEAIGFAAHWPGGRFDGAGAHHEVMVRRGPATVVLELHHTLDLLSAPAPAVWERLSADAQTITLGGTAIRVPAPAAASFVVAIHAAQHGLGASKPLRDLDAAVARVEPATWRAAAAIAADLGATAEFTVGLRLCAGGRGLADRLGLAPAPAVSRQVSLKASTAPETALGIEQLVTTPGLRARVALLAGKLAPSPVWMRNWLPFARRGRRALACAYVWRLIWLLIKLPAGARAWRAAARPSGSPSDIRPAAPVSSTDPAAPSDNPVIT